MMAQRLMKISLNPYNYKLQNHMKKILFLAVALCASMQIMAANVNVETARLTALNFMKGKAVNGRFMAPQAPQVKWIHQEMNSSNVEQAAYYIVNTDAGFVIVAGDDRAQSILAYGDAPLADNDIKSLPENMRFWLDYYKQQIEVLQARPGMMVNKPTIKAGGQSVEPMLEAMWDQGDPYYGMCPMAGDRRAQTGCGATSLAQVFYKWKFPTTPTPVLPGYTTKAWQIELPALPSIRFDWDNMLSTYTIFSPDANKLAVAQLMRYIGQAEHMDYTAEYGEAYEDDIVAACHTFGYVGAHVAYKSILYANGVDSIYIDDNTWEEMLQGELVAGRPVVYCAVSPNPGYDNYVGHAFDVDGYNATDGKYHVNWGWSGRGNGYFALNAFIDGNFSYNLNQLMVMGIEPPAPIESYTPVMQPADSAYINLTEFRAEWTDETPAENVTSYTLEVTTEDGSEPGVYEKVFTETFPYCNSNDNTAISRIDNYCTNKGWTGSYVYEAKGGLRLGSSTKNGTLTTPVLDMTQSGGKMTVVATMKPHSTDTNVPVRISCGASIVDVTVSTESVQTIILNCEADANQKVTFSTIEAGKRVVITQVDIWSSTASAAKMLLSVPVENGDSTSRLITDITDKFYTVKDLTAGGTFNYRVKAFYSNLTESEWSNVETVTLFENTPAFDMGDVNHDTHVDIDDITALIARVLGDTTGEFYEAQANVDGQGGIDIDDVTALITIVLGGH